MDNTRIIPVKFGKEHLAVTEYRMQHDWGQVLDFIDIVLPEAFEARFSNSVSGQSVGQIGYNNQVRIPKQFFESGEPIYCYITVHDEETDGRTLYTTKVPIKPSSERTEEEPEPEEESIITQAIAALNTAVDTTSQKAQEASNSADRAEQAADGIEAYVERAETAQSASESARDRAVQAETNSSASASIASEKASEAISSAATASQSAIDAEQESERAKSFAESSAQSAEAARQFAINAGNKAYDASESAQEASGYASSANTDAQTASQKASEASTSALNASQAKTDAETAKQASEAAQGFAEQARDEAITAKTSAESARSEAQDIVDGITDKVEQIDSNTGRIESLEDDRYKPYPTDSASGSIASFSDGADDIPLKSCIVQVEPVQEGSGDPSPDNVRPISGFTGVEVQRTGKNLYPGTDMNAQWATLMPDMLTALKEIPIGTEFTISFDVKLLSKKDNFSSESTFGMAFLGYVAPNRNKWGNWSASDAIGTVRHFDLTLVAQNGLRTVYCYGCGSNANGVTGEARLFNIQLELGSTATDYEPYQGNTHPITFPSEAGTVYGAHIDVINGELVVDSELITLKGSEAFWSNIATTSGVIRAYTTPFFSGRNVIVSDSLMHLNSSVVLNAMRIGDGRLIITPSWMQGVTTLAEFKTLLAEHNINIVVSLATPIHYPLTSNQINSLLGQNNIWANTGDTSVTYRADTRLYIEKLTQPEEYDMIADSAITSGQFFMIGNSLYRALANIASGATITVGTNAQRVSLSDALNLVNA